MHRQLADLSTRALADLNTRVVGDLETQLLAGLSRRAACRYINRYAICSIQRKK